MNPSTLTQFLVDVTRGHRRDAFLADPDGVLAASTLDGATRAAVRAQDVSTLWLAGAHPMALLYFARASGWDNERYYRCITDAELTRSGQGAASPRAGPAPAQMHRSSARHVR